MPSILDALVARAHRITLAGRPYHPYFVASDAATVASLSAAFVLTRRSHAIPFFGFVAIYAAVLVLYRGFIWFKARMLGIPSRSFLQDSVLFLLPVYALGVWLAGYPIAAAFDLAGVVMPIFGGFARIGCFLGGCCYGVPWPHGVLYPATIFRPVVGWRRFRPGPDPSTRVAPTQLVEAAGLFVIGAGIFTAEWYAQLPRGAALPTFLLSYSVLRFLVDFFRRSSVRPRIGAFSEAQVVSLVVAAIAVVILVVLSGGAA
jgi:phosphatidylglycerol:prolipoprotein diacylglycerol transferase